jgi:hypothetical protein
MRVGLGHEQCREIREGGGARLVIPGHEPDGGSQ